MSDRESSHLAPAQIFEAATGQLSDRSVELHLETCEACQGSVDALRVDVAALKTLQSKQQHAGAECPSLEDLAHCYAGPSDERSARLLDHLTQCDRCAAIVADGLDSAEPEATPALPSSSGVWQREMAATFARESKKQTGTYRRYAAIAAAVLVVAGAGAWWRLRQLSEPAVLLAQAYTEARPFEFRLADRGYGPVRQTRGPGSIFDRPASLGAAETEIRQRLAARAGDPELLLLKGRAELMEQQYDVAIESLTKASEARPGDPELLGALGAAYAIRGSTENRNIDYGHALDLFLQALKKRPNDERDLFNLALTYESLQLLEEARDTWKRLLRGKLDPGWRREAETHQAAVEKILSERKRAERNDRFTCGNIAMLAG